MEFEGYAFCRAHSTAYALEAYESAHLKRYHPAEFLAGVLTHERGFYCALAYTVEARRLGLYIPTAGRECFVLAVPRRGPDRDPRADLES